MIINYDYKFTIKSFACILSYVGVQTIYLITYPDSRVNVVIDFPNVEKKIFLLYRRLL